MLISTVRKAIFGYFQMPHFLQLMSRAILEYGVAELFSPSFPIPQHGAALHHEVFCCRPGLSLAQCVGISLLMRNPIQAAQPHSNTTGSAFNLISEPRCAYTDSITEFNSLEQLLALLLLLWLHHYLNLHKFAKGLQKPVILLLVFYLC